MQHPVQGLQPRHRHLYLSGDIRPQRLCLFCGNIQLQALLQADVNFTQRTGLVQHLTNGFTLP
ncbi:MAG: hypothetical protein E7E83_21355, partial [Enterobacter ludwigii]|nr:hypothetical protein [Enterobacter ludwigii]